MTKAKTAWLLLAVLLLALWPGCRIVQEARWKKANEAGMKAHQEGRYAEAEQLWTAARKQAEKFGEQDARLASSLNNLALLYHAQGKYAEAEPLYRRSLAIRENALGPEHPNSGQQPQQPSGAPLRPGQVRRGRAAFLAVAGDR